MTAATGPRGPLGLTLGAGVGLLGLAAVLLVLGDLALFGDPALAALWTLLLGVFLVVGTMIVALLRAPSPDATEPPTPGEAAPDPEAELVRSLDSLLTASEEQAVAHEASVASGPAPAHVERTPAPAPATAAPRAVAGGAGAAVARAASVLPSGAMATARAEPASPTSIPAAYLQSLNSSSERDASLWSDVAPPIAAALPFSPGIRRRADAAPWSEEEAVEDEEPRLELELARLRARVRELEAPPLSPRGIAAVSAARGPEPPAPPARAALAHLACIACGSGVDAASPRLLCWGCGRTLCGGCYWRFGPGPTVHRCPDCAAGRTGPGPVTISGGRAGPSTGPTLVTPPPPH